MDNLINFTQYIPRENSGARSTNRLALQASFAITKIVDIFDSNFTIVMDIIDDVAFFLHENDNKIITYQLKTIDSKSNSYKLSKLMADDVFYKLYDHITQLGDQVDSIYLITNSPLQHSYKDPTDKKTKTLSVANSNKPFKDLHQEIRSKIEENMKKSKDFDQYGLSEKFKFSLWDITVTTHYEIAQAKLLKLCTDRYPYMDGKSITALHQTLYEHLINKQSYEFQLDEKINEVLPHKSYSSNELKALMYQATSVGSLTMAIIKEDYIPFNNLLEEVKYNKALAELKTKIFNMSELFERNFKLIEQEIIEELSNVATKKELFEVLKHKLHSKLIFELNDIEKDILLINGIEEIFKRGI